MGGVSMEVVAERRLLLHEKSHGARQPDDRGDDDRRGSRKERRALLDPGARGAPSENRAGHHRRDRLAGERRAISRVTKASFPPLLPWRHLPWTLLQGWRRVNRSSTVCVHRWR